MTDTYQRFLDTLTNANTLKVARSVKEIGEHDYSHCTAADIQKILLDMKPNSQKAIITTFTIWRRYAEFLGNLELTDILNNMDSGALWEAAKPNAAKKFISHSAFDRAYHEIGVHEELNAFYYQTLFKAVYEGIYNDDMSILKNLRTSDIHGDVVTLHEDNGHSYDLRVSQKLADDLQELSRIDTWERKNRYGVCNINLCGVYHDSCFKVELRKGAGEYSYRYTYYRMLRKIAKEYLEYNLLPLQLYVSGMMHRIKLNLAAHEISLFEAFADNNKDRLTAEIIAAELDRCNCDTPNRNFRQMVKGHLDVFAE